MKLSKALARHKPPTVVCLEDDPDLARLITITLNAWRATVHVAYDGVHGLALIREHRPDVVLLDLALPGVGGWEICGLMRDDPELCDIPIVVLTALPAETQPNSTVLRESVAAYLLKPFSPAELRRTLDTLFASRAKPTAAGQ